MANRSYLYSTNVIPGPSAKANGRKLIGISECKYDIPIVFKLLLSGTPRTCPSSLWNNPEGEALIIALIGDYAAGVKNLEGFLSQIKLPEAQDLIVEAIAFLNKPENQNQYFVLECGEIFEMGETPLLEQNLALLEQVKDLQLEVEQVLQSLVSPEPPIRDLGLGNWSNILYYDFTS